MEIGIHGKVAEIIDEYSLVINKGEIDGVSSGMEFIVYLEGETIIDPETNDDLGYLEIVKARLKVTHIQEKFCIVRTFETQPGLYTSNIASYISAMQTQIQVPKPLNIGDLKDRPEPDLIIRVGDKVRSI